MATAVPVSTEILEERLERGAELLWERERQSKTDAEYEAWLEVWLKLLDEYQAASSTAASR
ncbi:MAG: hypothetical protein ACRDFS_11215 [Chloroflexota bacterium]